MSDQGAGEFFGIIAPEAVLEEELGFPAADRVIQIEQVIDELSMRGR
jgi:hypothetical protein